MTVMEEEAQSRERDEEPDQENILAITPVDQARAFTGSMLYATPAALDATVLACAASHVMELWQTVPRLLYTSPEGKSGKSTAIDICRMLGLNPWDGDDATKDSMRNKFLEPDPPFMLIDEVQTVFGTSGRYGQSSQVGRICRKGYRRVGAELHFSISRTDVVAPCFCFVAMAGLMTAVPPDIRTRCLDIPMVPRPKGFVLTRRSTDPGTVRLGKTYGMALHDQMRRLMPEMEKIYKRYRVPHYAYADRLRDIWEPLWVTALAVGGDWPDRCLSAFKQLALDTTDQPSLAPPLLMLRDAATVFQQLPEQLPDRNRLFHYEIKDAIRLLPPDSSASTLWKDLQDGDLVPIMTEGLGAAASMTKAGIRKRGYYAKNVLAKWAEVEAALLPPPPPLPEDPADFFDS